MRDRDSSTTVVNVRLPANTLEAVDSICNRLDMGRGDVMRRALKEGLKLFVDARLPGSDDDVEVDA
jgi:metal-responsive CopG/Arc/MetJ family transcriptional regulator